MMDAHGILAKLMGVTIVGTRTQFQKMHAMRFAEMDLTMVHRDSGTT